MPKASEAQVEALRNDGLVQAAEVARVLGHHTTTVTRKIENGEFPGECIGGFWYADAHGVLKAIKELQYAPALVEQMKSFCSLVRRRKLTKA
jgi:hypothetical protein